MVERVRLAKNHNPLVNGSGSRSCFVITEFPVPVASRSCSACRRLPQARVDGIRGNDALAGANDDVNLANFLA